jgi:hypothetical protein
MVNICNNTILLFGNSPKRFFFLNSKTVKTNGNFFTNTDKICRSIRKNTKMQLFSLNPFGAQATPQSKLANRQNLTFGTNNNPLLTKYPAYIVSTQKPGDMIRGDIPKEIARIKQQLETLPTDLTVADADREALARLLDERWDRLIRVAHHPLLGGYS